MARRYQTVKESRLYLRGLASLRTLEPGLIRLPTGLASNGFKSCVPAVTIAHGEEVNFPTELLNFPKPIDQIRLVLFLISNAHRDGVGPIWRKFAESVLCKSSKMILGPSSVGAKIVDEVGDISFSYIRVVRMNRQIILHQR